MIHVNRNIIAHRNREEQIGRPTSPPAAVAARLPRLPGAPPSPHAALPLPPLGAPPFPLPRPVYAASREVISGNTTTYTARASLAQVSAKRRGLLSLHFHTAVREFSDHQRLLLLAEIHEACCASRDIGRGPRCRIRGVIQHSSFRVFCTQFLPSRCPTKTLGAKHVVPETWLQHRRKIFDDTPLHVVCGVGTAPRWPCAKKQNKKRTACLCPSR